MQPAATQATEIDPRTPFADEVRALAHANARLGAAPDAVVFYGSSSIRLWETLEQDFAVRRVLNRGFGGSTLADCLREFERLVVPLKPQVLVLYAGDNDLDQGVPPEHLVWLFENLITSVRARLGGLPVLMLSVKPSPARFWNQPRICRANQLLGAASARMGVLFIDLYPSMLNERGEPRRELFCEDQLHLSRAGYLLWAEAVRRVLPGGG
jgi:lysophospholipase L1-like esterase